MFLKTPDDIELEKLIDTQKTVLEKTFQNNYITQQSTLEILMKSIEHCDFNNFSESRLIWNFASYINIISFDLKTIGENLFFQKNEWSKRYFARQSALLIYEAINDIFEMTGKELRRVISLFSVSEALSNELKAIIKNLNEYKITYFDFLKEIRHNCIAHRDKDSIEQIRIIASVKWNNAIEFTSKFDNILMDLGKFSQRLINISLEESKELKK
ncbi:hypothetical protein [Rufibacter aurantiacus]|uniref:AbiU2 domain-containing protein n=1 Tax=Rufibacter aurantiacus TaxID=2817374 RepID=UPI001B3127E5|nr:hypothetical protein [Rufibacter aurantiacus]